METQCICDAVGARGAPCVCTRHSGRHTLAPARAQATAAVVVGRERPREVNCPGLDWRIGWLSSRVAGRQLHSCHGTHPRSRTEPPTSMTDERSSDRPLSRGLPGRPASGTSSPSAPALLLPWLLSLLRSVRTRLAPGKKLARSRRADEAAAESSRAAHSSTMAAMLARSSASASAVARPRPGCRRPTPPLERICAQVRSRLCSLALRDLPPLLLLPLLHGASPADSRFVHAVPRAARAHETWTGCLGVARTRCTRMGQITGQQCSTRTCTATTRGDETSGGRARGHAGCRGRFSQRLRCCGGVDGRTFTVGS